MIVARIIFAANMLAIVAWIIAWRRARPDLCPLWLAAKLSVLLTAIAVAALSVLLGSDWYVAAIVCADVVGSAVAVRLWLHRSKLLGPAEAAAEARRLADEAMRLADMAEREMREARRG